MRYSNVYLNALGYELAPVVVASRDIEKRLAPIYQKLRLPEGQFESLTGIKERRWWPEGQTFSEGAIAAARNALTNSTIQAQDIDVFIYASVGREYFEPATATTVANAVGVSPDAEVYDISNACLAAVNGIINIANAIELGHCKAGMVVSCESAREINESTIRELLQEEPSMTKLIQSLTTFTGGSGASAIVLTDASLAQPDSPRLIGGVCSTEPRFHDICRWGMFPQNDGTFLERACTDPISVLKHGLQLGKRTWDRFLNELGWIQEQIDKVVCHQVAAKNNKMMLETMGLSENQNFPTYSFLGNMGTASLPVTAAMAREKGFLQRGDKVGFLGIGSGLNCLMLGWEW